MPQSWVCGCARWRFLGPVGHDRLLRCWQVKEERTVLLVEPDLARPGRRFGPDGACVAREAGYRLGSERGSPNHGSTLASKRVMAQIRSPARVST